MTSRENESHEDPEAKGQGSRQEMKGECRMKQLESDIQATGHGKSQYKLEEQGDLEPSFSLRL